MKNKSVGSCRFVHHAKFHCLIKTLNKLFEIEIERGDWKKASKISPEQYLNWSFSGSSPDGLSQGFLSILLGLPSDTKNRAVWLSKIVINH